MTEQEREEYAVLKLATEAGVFAAQLGGPLPNDDGGIDRQGGLDRLLRRRWVTLMDISPIAIYPDRMFRIFLATDEAMQWFRRQS